MIRTTSDELLINDKVQYSQSDAVVLAVGNGFAVAWSDMVYGPFAGPPEEVPEYVLEFEQIRMRAFTGEGEADGRTILVGDASPTRVFYNDLTAAVLASGDIAVAWQVNTENGDLVQTRRLDASLDPISGVLSTELETGPILGPSLAPTFNDDYILNYRANDSLGVVVGESDTLQSQEPELSAWSAPELVALADGRVASFVVPLPSGIEDVSSVQFRILNANGQFVGEPSTILTVGDSSRSVSAVSLENGLIAVAVEGSALVVDQQGTVIVPAFTYGGTGSQITDPEVAALDGGGFLIAWVDRNPQTGDGSGSAIKAQAFSSTGQSLGAEIVVNSTTTGDQFDPSIATLADGNVVVTWTDLSASGPDTSGSSVRGVILSADQIDVPIGAQASTAASEILRGTSAADIFFFDTDAGASLGNDTIRGFGAGDRLVTTSKLVDPNDDGRVRFDNSDRLSLFDDGAASDQVGSLKMFNNNGKALSSLVLVGEEIHDGASYYVYAGAGDLSASPDLFF